MALLLAVLVALAAAQEQFPGPATPADFDSWLAQWTAFRTQTRETYHYDDSIYSVPELIWTQTGYIQPQMMSHDRYFYDPVARAYTVDKYLDDLETRYGGIDAVLIWPTYPNIGIDNRNQFDMWRSMPGGVTTLKQVSDQMHARGVHVLYPYNPWDQGTRPEGTSDDVAIANLLASIDGDGFNGDTMGSIPESFYTASVSAGRPLALEPEGGGSFDTANWDTLGWGYWSYPFIPEVDEFKWITTKRLTNVCDRWNTYKTDNLQFAYFNGDGYESWENVWGIWNGIVPRDAEALRRVSTLLRYFGSRGFLQSPNWEPHTPVIQNTNVYASKWPGNSSDTQGETFWTFVNRGGTNLTGAQITLTNVASGLHFYDVYAGKEITPSELVEVGKDLVTVTLSFPIEAHGYGGLFATPQADSNLTQLLSTMASMTVHPLEYYDNTWHFLPQSIVDIPPTTILTTAPTGMTLITGKPFQFVVSGVEIEGDPLPDGVDVQYPWEPHPQRNHNLLLFLQNYYIDLYPVTNQQWATYLNQSKYVPVDSYNYLNDWQNGTYQAGWDKKPVTWISQDEARGYCDYYGKRLPHEWEWQFAAQGSTGYLYPWGNSLDYSRIPPQDNSRDPPPPADVDAHPTGASPFGVFDMVGNVWQWTDEFVDDHTRAAILRGGSYYRPSGSTWYFPPALQLNQHGKYLLMGDSLDRSGLLGFRCVVDAPPPFCSSALCASIQTPYYTSDLTQEGTTDWVHWGLNNSQSVDRKQGANVIPQFKIVGTGTVGAYNNNPNSYSWSDGTPDSKVTATTTGVYLSGQDNGFQLTVPTQTYNQTLRLYLGVYQSTGKLSASLSDGSAPVFTDTSITNQAGTSNAVYQLQFSSKTSGATLSVSWTQQSIECTQNLCASVGSPLALIDLTQEGTLDWIHWGLSSATSVDRKKGVTAQISNFQQVGSAASINSYSNNPTSFEWSDGTPTASSSGTPTGIYVAGTDRGFSISAPADTTTKTLRVYVGVWEATGTFTVEISDGSSTWTDSTLSNDGGTTNGVYLLRYRANSAGQSIKVTWTQKSGNGNITLQAASLSPDAQGNVTLQSATLQKTPTNDPKPDTHTATQ